MKIQGVRLIQARAIDHPPMVATGLQQYYDIGNTSSYSGSGSSVTDLSASGYGAGTLVSSPTYTSAGNRSYLSFNGTNNYFYTPNLYSMVSSTLNVTLEVWVRTSVDNGIIIDEQGTTPFNSGWHDSQMEIVSGTLKATEKAGSLKESILLSKQKMIVRFKTDQNDFLHFIGRLKPEYCF